jgi:toxin CptA
MPTSRISYDTFEPCRLEWRPSRLLVVALATLGVLAATAIVATDLSPLLAWPSACAAALYGGWLALREHRRPSHVLVMSGLVTGGDRQPHVDGERVDDFNVTWRGPLAFVRWRGAAGRCERCFWGPDTLPAPARRELRLALSRTAPARPSKSMAT